MSVRKRTGISLDDPYLKTTRAKTHLDALRDEINAFYKSEPIRIFREDDVKRQLYCIRIVIATIPSQLPLIAGDLFYCLRSSLDQAVWALAKRKIGTGGYPTHTQFPIFDHNTARNRAKFTQYTTGIPAAAIGIIKSLQPYHRADPAAHLLPASTCYVTSTSTGGSRSMAKSLSLVFLTHRGRSPSCGRSITNSK